MRRTRTIARSLVASLLVLAACGDADDQATMPTTSTTGETSVAGTEASSAPSSSTTDGDPVAATTSTGETPNGTAAPVGTAGCGAGDVEPGVSLVRIESGGIDREYRLYVPAGHDGSTPLPVVLDFHGLGSNAEQQAALSNLEGLAGVEGFVAVHPQGTSDPDSGSAFFEFGVGGSAVDDIGFTSDVLDHVEATLCVDSDRVYSTGFSNGGYMSSRLACDLSDRIAAVAPVAATFHPDDCAPTRPVPVLAFHGTADVVVPYDGGSSVLSGGSTPESIVELLAQAIPDEVAQWGAANGCAGSADREVSEEVVLTAHDGCAAPVALYSVEGGGHTWPGSLLARAIPSLGYTTTDIDATALAWEFFQQHQR